MNTPTNWFRDIATYTNWPQMPNAHGPFGKDRLTATERKKLRGVPLFFNVQSAAGIREAHRLGGKALSYLSFMDTYVHTAGFENGTARVPWTPRKAQMLLINKDGCFVNTRMDATRRMWRCYVCNNTREYADLALHMVHDQMRKGADGIFVDNSSMREPCYGHGFPVGYWDPLRSVLTAIPEWKHPDVAARTTPEALYRAGEKPRFKSDYRMIAGLPKHRHIYPDKSHDYAYARLLEKVRRVVRSYGADKVVVVNGNTTPYADAVMLESFIYSWAWKGRDQGWAQTKAEAAAHRAGLRRTARLIALSYFGNTDRTIAEDACYSFAAAALLGYLWSDYGTCTGKTGKTLRTLRLGKRLTPLTTAGKVDYAYFDGGLVAINGSSRACAVKVPVPPGFKLARLNNLLDGSKVVCTAGAYRLMLPANSGRIYTR